MTAYWYDFSNYENAYCLDMTKSPGLKYHCFSFGFDFFGERSFSKPCSQNTTNSIAVPLPPDTHTQHTCAHTHTNGVWV